MTMRKWAMGAAAMVLLAGCQTRYLPVDDAGNHTALPPAASATAPPVAPPAPSALPAAPIPLAVLSDTCGAGALRYLIGKPKTQIPVPVDLSKRQVICTGCAAAPQNDPARVTILFDQTSGIVTEVMCR